MAKTIGKCYCGGNIKQYPARNFIPIVIKCDRCGGGDAFYEEELDHTKVKQLVKALGSEEGW